MPNTIFISYRRADSQLVCDRIYDSLRKAFGNDQVFRDVNTIAGGVDFRLAIEQALKSARVELVLIGPQWLTITDESGARRLDGPQDRVRQEIEMALRTNIIIVPALTQQATMPRESELPPAIGPLAYRNSRVVRPDPDYERDIQALIHDIAQYLPAPPRALPIRSAIGMARRTFGFALSFLTIVLTAISLATWINIPILSDLIKRLLGH